MIHEQYAHETDALSKARVMSSHQVSVNSALNRAPGSWHEKVPEEDEVIVLEVKDDLVDRLCGRGGIKTFDGWITDYYFDFYEKNSEQHPLLGDSPRIRCKEEGGVQSFEVTIKGKKIPTASGGARAKEKTLEANSFEDAYIIMKNFLRNDMHLPETDIETLYLAHTWIKARTSIQVGNVTVDRDVWRSRKVFAPQPDEVLLLEEIVFSVPPYAEFEVMYENPDGNIEKMYQVKNLIAERDGLIRELGYTPSDIRGTLREMCEHYGIKTTQEIKEEYCTRMKTTLKES